MQKKIYYLSTCDTCKRIIRDVGIGDDFVMQDIKFESISEDQLDEMAGLSGSFESLFSRKARKFRSLGLGEKQLDEQDYRKLILEEYTFLKRPVVLIDNTIFIGNAAKTIAALKARLTKN